jgi:hypothetical protein
MKNFMIKDECDANTADDDLEIVFYLLLTVPYSHPDQR